MKTKQLSNSDFFITPTRFGTSAWEQSLDPIHRALELLGRISPTAAMVLAVVLVAVIAWFDYVTRLLAGVVLPRAGGSGYLACRSSKRVDHRRVERRGM